MKKFYLFLAFMGISTLVFADAAYVVDRRINRISAGEEMLQSPIVENDLVVLDDLNVGGAFESVGALTASTLGISEGYFDVVNTTQLVFIADSVTNVIDEDITN